MNAKDVKALTEATNELGESYASTINATRRTAQEAEATKKLWRTSNKSILIKVGVALIAFPDPTVSDVVGAALVAAGTVQEGIKRRTLYVDDAVKTFQKTFKELRDMKNLV